MKSSIVLFIGIFALGRAQLFKNKYGREDFSNTFKPGNPYAFGKNGNDDGSNEGKYVHTNDGAYYHDNSGVYIHDDRRYEHQEEKYKHDDDKYKHYEPKYAESKRVQKIVPAENLYGINPGLQKGNAAGLYDNKNYRIIRKIENVGNDKYFYLYETENGIYAEEQGKVVKVGSNMESIMANGYFTYTGPDSIIYTVKYSADENGFVAEAAHLPTPPPIPEDIARALEYQRSQGTL